MCAWVPSLLDAAWCALARCVRLRSGHMDGYGVVGENNGQFRERERETASNSAQHGCGRRHPPQLRIARCGHACGDKLAKKSWGQSVWDGWSRGELVQAFAFAFRRSGARADLACWWMFLSRVACILSSPSRSVPSLPLCRLCREVRKSVDHVLSAGSAPAVYDESELVGEGMRV